MSPRWITRSLTAAALVGALALTGCASGSSGTTSTSGAAATGEIQEGGTATIALDREVATLDVASGTITQQPLLILANALYEPLMKPAPGGTYEPDLAESFEPDETAAVWTLTLPEGLTFSDGSPFTAESVKAHLERLADPASGSSFVAQASQITDMAVESDTVLVMTLAAPNADFVAQFARGMGMVVSTTAKDAFGFPLGAGPYQVEDFVSGDSVTVVRNENYQGEPGHLDEIVYKMMPDADTRMQSLQAEDVDVTWSEVTSQFVQARSDEALSVHTAPAAVATIVLNMDSPKFADVEVRHALAQAIDRDAINAVVNLGEGTTVDSPYSLLGDLAPEIDYPEYDPDAARKVLEGKNLTFSLSVTNRSDTLQRATAIKDMLSEVGVTVELDPLEAAAFGEALSTRSFEAADFITSIFSDPSGGAFVAGSESQLNFTGYANDEVNEAIARSNAMIDRADRVDDLTIISQDLADDLPFLWLTAANAGYISSADLVGMPDLEGITLISIQPADLAWTEQ